MRPFRESAHLPGFVSGPWSYDLLSLRRHVAESAKGGFTKDDFLIQNRGLTPSDSTSSFTRDLMAGPREEAPATSTLRISLKKTSSASYQGTLQINSSKRGSAELVWIALSALGLISIFPSEPVS